MTDKIQGDISQSGYNKVKMYDEKLKKTTTYLIPFGQNLTVNGNTYELDNAKNNEIVFKGTDIKDSNFNLMGLALEHMDVNNDGKIDQKDSDNNMAQKINQELEERNSQVYVKDVSDVFSNAGMFEGQGCYRVFVAAT